MSNVVPRYGNKILLKIELKYHMKFSISLIQKGNGILQGNKIYFVKVYNWTTLLYCNLNITVQIEDA